MHDVHFRYTKVGINSREFRAAVAKVSSIDRWNPLFFNMEEVISSAAGFPIRKPTPDLSQINSERNKIEPQVEVFVSSDAIFSAMTYPNYLVDFAELRRHRITPSIVRRLPETGILIAGLTMGEASAEGAVREFASIFENAIKDTMDGRRSRHIEFSWTPADLFGVQKETLVDKIEAEGSDFKFSSAALDAKEVEYAGLLSRKVARELIRELSESGFAREQDLLSKRGSRQEEFQIAINSIRLTELVSIEYLIQCRKNSSQLLKASNKEDLDSTRGIDLRCASCNRSYSDELILEGFSLTELGKGLLNGSHWLTVWVTELLVHLGVPLSSIYWNIEESSEEVDIVVDYIDMIWIFELKDRDFGAGDAYPFNYRKTRYAANKAVIVTTGKVSADARRVFVELQGKADTGGPIIIEGLDRAGRVLKEAFEQAGALKARRFLRLLTVITGYDYSARITEADA